MSDLVLRATFQTVGHTEALKTGSVATHGFRFDLEEVSPIIRAFRRMVRNLDFDVSEMAATTYLAARAHGARFTALPVFLVRAFHHGAIVCAADNRVGHPRDLEGRRVGVNRGYTVTTGVWARSILQHEYGVDLSKITWVLSGDEHVADFRPPANVEPLVQGSTLESALLAGGLAAAIGIPATTPGLRTLIAAPDEAAFRALSASGHYPINHLLVVKDSVLAAEPGIGSKIFEAFAAAKLPYLDSLRADRIAKPSQADRLYARVMQVTGRDPLPYGVEPNRLMLESLIRYAGEQGILRHAVSVEALFASDCLNLTA
jgi:hypothetical protein